MARRVIVIIIISPTSRYRVPPGRPGRWCRLADRPGPNTTEAHPRWSVVKLSLGVLGRWDNKSLVVGVDALSRPIITLRNVRIGSSKSVTAPDIGDTIFLTTVTSRILSYGPSVNVTVIAISEPALRWKRVFRIVNTSLKSDSGSETFRTKRCSKQSAVTVYWLLHS